MLGTIGTLEVVRLTTLVNATGSQSSPVRGLQFSSVGFRDTAPATFTPHVAPTGGDWAVNRAAAVTVAGATDFHVENSIFWRLDNAGVFLGSYPPHILQNDALALIACIV